jgi:hypothetical protein
MSILSSKNVMRTRIIRPEMSIYTGLVIPYDGVAIQRCLNVGKQLHDAPTPARGTSSNAVEALPSNKTSTTTQT